MATFDHSSVLEKELRSDGEVIRIGNVGAGY